MFEFSMFLSTLFYHLNYRLCLHFYFQIWTLNHCYCVHSVNISLSKSFLQPVFIQLVSSFVNMFNIVAVNIFVNVFATYLPAPLSTPLVTSLSIYFVDNFVFKNLWPQLCQNLCQHFCRQFWSTFLSILRPAFPFEQVLCWALPQFGLHLCYLTHPVARGWTSAGFPPLLSSPPGCRGWAPPPHSSTQVNRYTGTVDMSWHCIIQ